MSTDTTAATPTLEGSSGFPELSPLGKRIELLRISRGLTKQQLARDAGTSRQQLWRVMTGKSELTSSLGFRLSQVLQVDGHLLSASADTETLGLPFGVAARMASAPPPPSSLAEFVAEPAAVERTLASLPSDDLGRRLKRMLLNSIEDLAAAEGLRLPASFFALRGRVMNGEL
jgi:transcriptional regulator with XRE-family HTH domain